MSGLFTGFPKQGVKFLKDLKKHNDREWFKEHKGDFEELLLNPAMAFVEEMGERLRELSPGVNAIPKVDKSIFRIHRDTRFSKDKSPYKTHIGILFWDGVKKKMECPGYYFHFDTEKLNCYGGLYEFSKPALAAYREAVVDDKLGAQLKKIVGRLEKQKLGIRGQHYKKVPRGMDPEHPNAELLKHSGLWAAFGEKHPPEMHSPELVDWCIEPWKKMLPLHDWLKELNERV